MKPTLTGLKTGDTIRALVYEVLDARQIIFSFDGDLLRVLNSTGRSFAVGEEATLRVSDTKPLQFQFAGERTSPVGRFDKTV